MPRRALLRNAAVAACIVATLLCGATEARQSRSSSKRAKLMQEQKAYLQLEMMRYQSAVAAKQQEIYQSFDKDGDGKLSPPEKSRYDKHMHAIQKGTVENPFAWIPPVGQGPRPKSPIQELEQQAAQYQAGLLAKQQEIVRSFDENSDGELKGPEKSKFEKYMHDVQTGKVPDPFAAVGAAVGNSAGGK